MLEFLFGFGSFIKIEICLATQGDESDCTKGHKSVCTIQGYLVVASLCLMRRALSPVGAYTGQGTDTPVSCKSILTIKCHCNKRNTIIIISNLIYIYKLVLDKNGNKIVYIYIYISVYSPNIINSLNIIVLTVDIHVDVLEAAVI